MRQLYAIFRAWYCVYRQWESQNIRREVLASSIFLHSKSVSSVCSRVSPSSKTEIMSLSIESNLRSSSSISRSFRRRTWLFRIKLPEKVSWLFTRFSVKILFLSSKFDGEVPYVISYVIITAYFARLINLVKRRWLLSYLRFTKAWCCIFECLEYVLWTL